MYKLFYVRARFRLYVHLALFLDSLHLQVLATLSN